MRHTRTPPRRGRDASCLAPPAQTRTCSFPAYGSHLGYPRRIMCAVCRPAPGARVPGTVPGACGAGLPFPSASALGSTGSAAVRSVADCSATICSTLFVGFTATMAELDFSCPCIIGYDSSSSRCGPSLARNADGQPRDLPASDAIRLHVMWPWTPAGRQHLAKRCRTCCLRANKDSRPLRCMTFFVAQSHTPCNRCVRFATTVASDPATLATKRTLLLTWTGLAPAGSHQLCLAHLFNQLVHSSDMWLIPR